MYNVNRRKLEYAFEDGIKNIHVVYNMCVIEMCKQSFLTLLTKSQLWVCITVKVLTIFKIVPSYITLILTCLL